MNGWQRYHGKVQSGDMGHEAATDTGASRAVEVRLEESVPLALVRLASSTAFADTVMPQALSTGGSATSTSANELPPVPGYSDIEVQSVLAQGGMGQVLLPRRKPWAWLLKHVFEQDVSVCPHCQGHTTWLEVATEPDAIDRALVNHGLAPPRAPPPPLPELSPDAQLTLPL
jgi:hypothetical protein